jgi:hypothetical protein
MRPDPAGLAGVLLVELQHRKLKGVYAGNVVVHPLPQAARRSPSICLSHRPSWCQLAKIRLTSPSLAWIVSELRLAGQQAHS